MPGLSRARLALAALFGLVSTLPAFADDFISGYVTGKRWLQAAEDAANARVTYEICGWGIIDPLSPLLLEASGHGYDVGALNRLVTRFEAALKERRRNEALLTAFGANAPQQRMTGLYATDGCSESVRRMIESRTYDHLGGPRRASGRSAPP